MTPLCRLAHLNCIAQHSSTLQCGGYATFSRITATSYTTPTESKSLLDKNCVYHSFKMLESGSSVLRLSMIRKRRLGCCIPMPPCSSLFILAAMLETPMARLRGSPVPYSECCLIQALRTVLSVRASMFITEKTMPVPTNHHSRLTPRRRDKRRTEGWGVGRQTARVISNAPVEATYSLPMSPRGPGEH